MTEDSAFARTFPPHAADEAGMLRSYLDYFRATGQPPDARLGEAVDLVRRKQQEDGTWLLENTHPGLVYFSLEAGDGQPSRWNTLRALRVLNWAQSSTNPD